MARKNVGKMLLTDEPQIDHNEPGKPWTCHESYEVPDDATGHGGHTGTRRVAYGKTLRAAFVLGQYNARRYPAPIDVPQDAALGKMPFEPAPDGNVPASLRLDA